MVYAIATKAPADKEWSVTDLEVQDYDEAKKKYKKLQNATSDNLLVRGSSVEYIKNTLEEKLY